MDDVQKSFESVFECRGYDMRKLGDQTDVYSDIMTDGAWRGWQAALSYKHSEKTSLDSFVQGFGEAIDKMHPTLPAGKCGQAYSPSQGKYVDVPSQNTEECKCENPLVGLKVNSGPVCDRCNKTISFNIPTKNCLHMSRAMDGTCFKCGANTIKITKT